MVCPPNGAGRRVATIASVPHKRWLVAVFSFGQVANRVLRFRRICRFGTILPPALRSYDRPATHGVVDDADSVVT